MSSNAIIAPDGQRLAAFPYNEGVRSGVEWRGVSYSQPEQVAEWMELLDASGELVGVQLDSTRDLHPRFWQWLHRFSNVSFDDYGGAQILFRQSATHRLGGPYLPVDAFGTLTGDFVLYVPELFWSAQPDASANAG